MASNEIWEIWYPDAAATGLLFARGRPAPTPVLWVHATPPTLDVTIREGDQIVARGRGLKREGERLPMTRLNRTGERIERADRWPTDADLGCPVMLPGGEIGILKQWWHAADGSEWRWQVEFYNHV